MIKEWAVKNSLIRVCLLTGSRASSGKEVDLLSDYDIDLYVNNLDPFLLNDDWLEPFGPVMIRWPYAITGQLSRVIRIPFSSGLPTSRSCRHPGRCNAYTLPNRTPYLPEDAQANSLIPGIC